MLIGHTTSIRAVVCLRLPVAIYVLCDAPACRRFWVVCGACIFYFIDMLVILSRHVNVYYLWFDVRFMVLSVMFLFLRFCCVLILFGFIMVHPIVLFFIVSFECVLRVMYYLLYMIRLEVFVLWDREWMMPLRFIRSTNTVLFLLFILIFLLL